MDKAQDNTIEQDKPKPAKHTGSKLAFALAFSTVGAKLSTIGTAVDAADLLKDQPTFKEKMKTLFSKDIIGKLNERTIEHISDDFKRAGQLVMQPPMTEVVKATMKTMKWTLITGVVGTVAGGVVGWMRGDKAGSAKNIVKHPIRAVKAVFGFSEPLGDDGKPMVAAAQETPVPAKAAPEAQADEKASTAWQARVAKNAAPQTEASRSL